MNTDYSTQWLQDAAVAPALPGLLAGLVSRLRHVLGAGWPAYEQVTAITEELDALAPPPPPDPAADGPLYGQQAIGALLATSTSPATMLFSKIAGAPVRFAVWTSASSVTLDDGQCAVLHVRKGTLAKYRRGTFELDGRVLADVTSVVVTGLLPCKAVASLEAGTPLGAVIAATGRREPCSVTGWGGGVQAEAVMWAAGRRGREVRVAIAAETVHPWFCQRKPAVLPGDAGAHEAQVAEQVHDRFLPGLPESAAAGVQV